MAYNARWFFYGERSHAMITPIQIGSVSVSERADRAVSVLPSPARRFKKPPPSALAVA